MSDDGLYTVSTILRETMPRGFHHVIIKIQGSKIVKELCFRGIKKFTGLTAHDEDEESNSTTVNFFFNGKTRADAVTIFQTEKSNGENAKFGVTVADGITFFTGWVKKIHVCVGLPMTT
eukprot:UN13437